MAEYFYTTIEVQQGNDGTFSTLSQCYKEEEGQISAHDRAASAYHLACSSAVLSKIPYHAVYLLRSDGAMPEEMVCDRRTE